MPGKNEPQRPMEQNKKHDYWTALKLAYQEYAASAEATQTISSEESDRGPEFQLIRAIEVQQRAFQQYVEARIRFLECHMDEAHAPDGLVAKDRGSRGRLLPVLIRKSIPYAAIAAVACLTILSIGPNLRPKASPLPPLLNPQLRPYDETYALAARPETHDVNAVAGQSGRSGVDKAITPTNFTRSQQSINTVFPVKQLLRPHPMKAIRPSSHKVKATAPMRQLGKRVHYEFALSSSQHIMQLGPIRVILTAMDPQRRSVRLSVVSDAGVLESNHPLANQRARNIPRRYEASRGLTLDGTGMSSFP